MTREEKIKEVLNKHFGHEVKEGSDEWYTLNYQNRFRDLDEMADWCDQHPRKGLWDSKKVTEWLEDHVREYKYYDSDFADGNIDVEGLIETLTKAMETES